VAAAFTKFPNWQRSEAELRELNMRTDSEVPAERLKRWPSEVVTADTVA